MRILVTGGAGFIGSHLVRWLLRNQPDVAVTTFDALTYAGSLDNLRDVGDDRRHRFVRADVTDHAALAEVLPDHDAVVHLAAETHVDRSIESSGGFVATNVGGTHAVLEQALRAGGIRVLHMSTDEVYGSVESGFATESAPLAPRNPYAASKAGADLLARAFAVTHGLAVTVIRGSNAFGSHHFPEKVIPRFVTAALSGEALPVYGDGRHERDWTYVDDLVRAVWLVLRSGAPGDVYNVGANNHRSNRMLADAVLARCGGAGAAVARRVPDRPAHDRRYAVDSSRIRALGWSPEVTFDDGLDRTVAWYRANEWWWRPRLEGAQRRGLDP